MSTLTQTQTLCGVVGVDPLCRRRRPGLDADRLVEVHFADAVNTEVTAHGIGTHTGHIQPGSSCAD